jgi:hypothetical protein
MNLREASEIASAENKKLSQSKQIRIYFWSHIHKKISKKWFCSKNKYNITFGFSAVTH